MAIGKHYDLDTDGTLANNSDNTIASQKAVKTYVDNKTVVDSALSDSSTNPVQNKVIKSALDNKQDTISDLSYIRNKVELVDDKIGSQDITDSGSSLPVTTDYSIGDTFLNTTDNKLYATIASAYQASTNTTIYGTSDLNTGIVNNGGVYRSIGQNYSPNTDKVIWLGDVTIYLHFKFTSIPNDTTNYAIFRSSTSSYGTPGSTREFQITLYSKQLHLRFFYISGYGSTNVDADNLLLTTELQANTEYFLKIEKIDTLAIASLMTGSYNGTIIETNSIETEDYMYYYYYVYNDGQTIDNTVNGLYLGQGNTYYGIATYQDLYVYLLDSSKNYLVADGALQWDSGVTLEDNTQYNDITNEKTYYYNNSILYKLAEVATSGSYNDLSNKPIIPTVNNNTITIQKNGTAVDSFTLNQSSDKSINITMSKSDVGLNNVDNTSDANKPISTATQTELNKKIQQNDILQNLNQYNSSDRTRIWLSSLDNTLYRANKRFTVTLTNFDTTDSTNLFDMNWDSDVRISSGKIGTINITGATNLGMSYPYGYIYISFYGGNSPTNISQISGRMYQNWSGHNTGWVNLSSFTAISTGTYGGVEHIKVARVAVGTYGIQQIEINIDNTDGVGYENTKIWITQVEFFCSRTGIGSLPVLTKRGGDTIYGNLTIPTTDGSFIGNLNGNANTATKATKDDDGNTISTTYLKASEIPTQSGNSGKFLTTNGSTMSWANASLVKFRDWSD